MSYKNILMAVERDFHTTHVGVLRVIRYHYSNLIARGHSVTLASYINGQWISCSLLDAAKALLGVSPTVTFQDPYWQSGSASQAGLADAAPREDYAQIKWNGPAVRPEQFDESILTNPWLCSQGGAPIADSHFTVGIVYDMVPNLIALGLLRMPQFIDIFAFANDHHVGYEYFLRNVDTISCISESTRHDFIKLYGNPGKAKISVCIPFDDFGHGKLEDNPAATDVLMINMLDHRKNFLTAAKALKLAAASEKLHVVIVGRERLAKDDVLAFLVEISACCASVRWYRSPSDAQMQSLMSQAKVVFFPSFYEGLGLPILEAQARGIPVISSNNSSCGEINLNKDLTNEPYNHQEFADKLVSILSGRLPLMQGLPLREAQSAMLKHHNQLFKTTSDAAVAGTHGA
jgi:glycosyltransferase involved in cell wall biosynthesis